MALNSAILPIGPQQLFDRYLLHPETYPIWLVGADAIRSVDPGWPAPGTRFHHTVGVWPFHVRDHTESMAVDPPRTFVLSVRATPFVRGEVTFTVHGDADQSILTIEERGLYGRANPVMRPLTDPLIHVRNQASLRRLAHLIDEDRAAATP